MTRFSDKLLSNLRRDKISSVEGRIVPARRVLASDELLGELKDPAGVDHEQWETLRAQCKWLKDLIESKFDPSTPIVLPACTRELPLHGNTFF